MKVILEQLRDKQLYITCEKCEMLNKENKFLGLLIDKNSITVEPENVKVLQIWLGLKSVTDDRNFLVILPILGSFILNTAKIATLLTKLTKKCSGVHNCDEKCDTSSEGLKIVDTQAPMSIALD